jgi:hypothetical protein
MKHYLFILLTSIVAKNCTINDDCGKFGICEQEKCVCLPNTISLNNDGKCDYQKFEKLTAFLLTFLTGTLGIDRYVMSRGNGGAVCLGILKGLTAGGFTIWYIVDWIMVLTNTYKDGNGIPTGSEWVDQNVSVND